MRRTLLLSILIALCLNLPGNPVDETTAKQLAQNFWKENNIMGVKGDKVFKKKMDDARFVNVAPQCGYSEFFIFNNEDGKGFVILAADDCVTPILGYSYDNNFATENLPPNLKGWLDGYAEQIRMAVEMRATATDEIRGDWECLRRGRNLPIKSEDAVNNLISTQWGQGMPYNFYCPYNSITGSNTLTGCVATAMAQIMKFWGYPSHGYNYNSYHDWFYGQISANFGGTNYDWDNMIDDYSGYYNSVQRDAVATLMFHCGVSVNMNYGISSSGAQTTGLAPSSEDAYTRYFGYSSSLHRVSRNSNQYFNNSEWINLLKSELNANRPIHYIGYDSNGGGHSFICCGYDYNNKFYFNWGWNGNSDGNYYIDNISSPQCLYPFNQEALIGIQPDSNLQSYDLVLYDDVQMVGGFYGNYSFGQSISAYAEILNNGNSTFSGYIAAAVFDNDYYFIDFLGGGSATIEPNYWTSGTVTHEGGIPFLPCADYLYHTVMFYSIDGEHWTIVRSGNYSNDGVFQVFNNGEDIVANSDFTISTGDNVLYNGQTATINIDIINEGSETYYGMVWTALLDEEENYVQIIDTYNIEEGLPVNYHYTNGINFTNTITAPEGQYYLGLLYIDAQNSAHYAGSVFYPCLKRVYVINSTLEEDPYEPNNSQNLAYSFTPSFSGNSATVNTTGSNLHNSSDVDYYKINLNSGYDYTITPRLHDAFNSGDGNTYSVDAKFAYSIDGINWSDFYDDVMTGSFSIIDGGTVYFDVIPYFEDEIGTYLLSIGITRIQHTNDYTISVSASPSNGGNVSGGGTFTQGQTCTVNATANSGYTFVNWTENGTQVSTNPSYSFTINSNRNLVANFQAQPQQYTISVSASPSDGGNVSGDGTFTQGQTCTVNATANSGYTFVNWTENGTQVSTNPSYSFTVNSNRVLVANFQAQPQQYTISVSASPSDGGNVSGGGTFTQGQTCTVNATSNSGYTFVNWTESGTQVSTNPSYSFTVNGNRNLVANFQAQPQQYTISVSANPSNGGSVSGGGTFTQGQTCTVNATANSGYTFVNWTENGTQVSTNASYSFTVTNNRNLVANFAQNTYTITATAGANGFITPSGTVVVAEGSNQTFTIIPDYGYEIYEVYVDGGHIGAPSSYTFQNVASNHTIFATFIRIDGIDDNNGMAFVIYPNPTSGIVNILCHNAELFNIYNTYGQLLISQNTNGNDQVTIDISNLPCSIYLIQLVSKEGFATKQIIKIP